MNTTGVTEAHRTRFESKYIIDPATGCWIWQGYTDDGYGRFTLGGRSRRAHRVSWELNVGPIPEGLTIDHLDHDPDTCKPEKAADCPHRRCVNPAHLEVVPARENTRRGGSMPGVNGRRTVCENGHPLDGGNLYVRPDGRGRQCRQCHARIDREWKARRRAGKDAKKG